MSDELPALRLAIFGTPRCGNTWFRALLKTAYGLADYAEHDPADIPWDSLPPRSLVNLHAMPDDGLRERLRSLEIRPLVIARHPLDALISILHFAPHHRASNGWLLGRGGGEDAIRGAAPTSPEFRDYAAGPRAAALFSISSLWWDEPGTVRVRYEDLVADGVSEMSRVAAEIGAAPVRSIEEVVAEHAIDTLRVRDRSYQHHMWKGRPGLWKHLIPPALARSVAEAHPAAFEPIGYACDPDAALTDSQAHANWVATLTEANDRDVARLWDLVEAMRIAAEESRCRIADLEWRLSSALAGLDEQQGRLIRADEIIREKTALAAEARANVADLTERLIGADALINDATRRAAAAEEQSAAAEQRAALNEGAVGRLVAQVDAYHARLTDAESRLAGIDSDSLAVARRISRLCARFPNAARTAGEAYRKVRGDRRAA